MVQAVYDEELDTFHGLLRKRISKQLRPTILDAMTRDRDANPHPLGARSPRLTASLCRDEVICLALAPSFTHALNQHCRVKKGFVLRYLALRGFILFSGAGPDLMHAGLTSSKPAVIRRRPQRGRGARTLRSRTATLNNVSAKDRLYACSGWRQ